MTFAGLRMTVAPATTSLVALATVKARMGISPADTSQDALLAGYAEDASARICAYLDRQTLGLATYQQTRTAADLSSNQYWWHSSINWRRGFMLRALPVEDGSVSIAANGVAVTDWTLVSPELGILDRENTWPEDVATVATYRAGWLLPGQVTSWTAATAYAAGAWVRPTDPTATMLRFRVASAGTSGSTEPSWPLATGGSVIADGSVTWTPRAVPELPVALSGLCYLEMRRLREERPDDLTGQRAEEFSETYNPALLGLTASGLSPAVERGLYAFRSVR